MDELRVSAIPAFNDNYIWLISTEGKDCAVVDPGDHSPVIRHIEKHGLNLRHILITHHHMDHIGGVDALCERFPVTVTGPNDPRIGNRDRTVKEGDQVELPELGLKFEVTEVPGHTLSHIAYYGHGSLFCGDTLFSVGCGRLFEGSPEQMQQSLDKLSAFPGETAVYCAHEYTQSNCQFALAVEPSNQRLQQRAFEVEQARQRGQRTVPSMLRQERQVNPFLRTREPAVVDSARSRNPKVTAGVETLAEIRRWKDSF